MVRRSRTLSNRPWLHWLALNISVFGYFGYAFVAPSSAIKASLLPGTTTHGHYQIELDCNVCHGSSDPHNDASVTDVMQDACNRCHAAQLETAGDTHPAKKFNDPSNADVLATLDAQNCLTCHQEHVPHQTQAMGLTMPSDYCWHCHQEVAESRPSHVGMKFDSCATAGCHNYHDNRALYEKHLADHFGERDFAEVAVMPRRNFADRWSESHPDRFPLAISEVDHPDSVVVDPGILSDWAETAHAAAGVNCSGCHRGGLTDGEAAPWSNSVEMSACETCHEKQVASFATGKHGMRIAAGMSPMTPSLARMPMHTDAAHRELTCNACHTGHRFDTQYAAVTACQGCHADSHSLAYAKSSHALLWQRELAGELPAGSGVTCAGCHMPRLDEAGEVWVNHDQNDTLRPNETMAREVCSHCHGLEFSLSALADLNLIQTCYDRPPEHRIESVQMAHDYFEQRRLIRERRQTKK